MVLSRYLIWTTSLASTDKGGRYISNETLKEISKVAEESELGVRAIKQTLKSMFSDALFSTADSAYKTHVITYKVNIN